MIFFVLSTLTSMVQCLNACVTNKKIIKKKKKRKEKKRKEKKRKEKKRKEKKTKTKPNKTKHEFDFKSKLARLFFRIFEIFV